MFPTRSKPQEAHEYLREENITAAAPAGGCVNPNAIMHVQDRATDREILVGRSKTDVLAISIEITAAVICPNTAL